MNIGALLKSFIYIVSASLLYPVLFLLVILTLGMLVYAGSFFAEWIERSRNQKKTAEELIRSLSKGQLEDSVSYCVRKYTKSLQGRLSKNPPNVELEIENVLQEEIIRLEQSLDRIRMIIRIGPALGLIATLIPMGTGLAALGQGDMTRLSADLVIAFTTTVVGIAIGITAYFFYTIKRRWVEKDIKDMRLVTELSAGNYDMKGSSDHEIYEIK